jgi:hypothetical protein
VTQDSPWQRSRRPAWVRAVNAVGRVASSRGVLWPRLDEASLLDAARRRTGLSDFGDPRFREPLAIFLRALEQEAELTQVGRLLARHEVVNWLANRLEIEETFRQRPEIAAESIEQPIFVTGTGRSGTSILHELLALDPRNRALATWEALHPCPPPVRAHTLDDPRIARTEREVRLWARIAPIYETMHENGARLPQECIYLTAHEFASDLLSGNYQVPSYAAWLARADLAPAYRTHRRCLQLLQWRCHGERWVLKAPSHLWALDALLAVYPDARIVWTHRDPLAVVASMTSLMATLAWLRSDHVDPEALGRSAVRSVGFMLKRAMALRDAAGLGPDRVCDVRYQDFLRDPIETLSGVHSRLGIEWRSDVEQRMRAHLAARPRDRHGAHAYHFERTGLDPAETRERFRAYRERFDVPAEL